MEKEPHVTSELPEPARAKERDKGERTLRLGFGDYFLPAEPPQDINIQTAGARWQFILALQDVCPHFFRELRDDVYPKYANFSRKNPHHWKHGWRFETWQIHSDRKKQLTPHLMAWAQRYRVAEGWVLEGALETLWQWHRNPNLRRSLAINGFRQYVAERGVISDEEHHFHFRDWGWNPLWARWEDYRVHIENRFREKLTAYRQQMQMLAESRGAVRAPVLQDSRSFQWLALFQCCGLSLEEITSLPGRAQEKTVISKGIHKAARFIGIKVRPKTPKLKNR